MENIVTLFLLFSYSVLLGGFAFKMFIYDRYRAARKLRELRERAASMKKDSLLDRVTDPVVNAQYEITRVSRSLRKKMYQKTPGEVEVVDNETSTEEEMGCEKFEKLESIVENKIVNVPLHKRAETNDEFKSSVQGQAAGVMQAVQQSRTVTVEKTPEPAAVLDEGPIRYELDENTLNLLVKTLSYDEFAKLYERFLHASGEDEICALIPELSSFRDDERIIMILTPLLSNKSSKIQNAVHEFISSTENLTITDDIVSVIENTEYRKRDSFNNYDADSVSGEFRDAGYETVTMSVDREIFNHEPLELVHEAYTTTDPERLFAISCALSAYNDPIVVEAQVYINALLNGEDVTPPKPSVKKTASPVSASAPTPAIERPAAQEITAEEAYPAATRVPTVKKYEFSSIDEVFKTSSPGVKMKKSPVKDETKNQHAKKPDYSNDYVRGMQLVNTAKYGVYEEFFPEFQNALCHPAPYLRCCSIMAMKTMAQRYFNQDGPESSEYNNIKSTLLSHLVGEKNGEVNSLCSRALAEIENFVRQTPEGQETHQPGLNSQIFISRDSDLDVAEADVENREVSGL